MVSATIQRIMHMLNDLNALKQTPVITGPGALKNALITSFGGSGYYKKGDYIGKGDRNMTIIGSISDAQFAKYVGRSRLRDGKDEEGSAMEMPHYLKGSTQDKEHRTYSCRVELMRSISAEKNR